MSSIETAGTGTPSGRRFRSRLGAGLVLLLMASSAPSGGVLNEAVPPPPAIADPASSAVQHNVLVIHSAHKGYGWTEAIMRGISDTLDSAPLESEIWIEYLDRKRARDPSYLDIEAELLARKLAQETFGVILATGNDALDFLLEHRGQLLPELPIVFCGVSGVTAEELSTHHDITGVVEDTEFAATIDLALSLHPMAREVVVIAPGSVNLSLLGHLAATAPIRVLRERELFDIEAKIAWVDEQTILLPIAEPRTPDGRFLPLDRFVRRLSAISHAPVYAVWEFALGHGIVGGKMVDGYDQGRRAAGLALGVLRGGPLPANLQVSNSRYLFDHEMLERFDVDRRLLPEGSVVISQPESFYRRYWKLVWSVVAVLGAMGLLIGVLLHSIWMRKRAEQALQERQQFFRDATEAASDWLWEMDGELRFTCLSDRFTELTGVPAAEVLGQRRWDVGNDDAASEKWQRHRETLEARRPFRDFVYRTRGLGPDGREHYFKINGKPIYDAEGSFRGYRGTGTDVSEQMRALRELRRIRALLIDIVDSMPSVLIGVDGNGKVTQWNRGAIEMTGIPRQEAVGRPLVQVCPSLASQDERVAQAIRSREAVEAERVVRQDDTNNKRHVDIMVYPLMAEDEAGAVIRIDDVSDRVRMEQLLVQTEKMVSIAGLAAGMAHEINNPLSAILQGTQNALRRLSPDLPANCRTAETLGLDLNTVAEYLERRGVRGFLEGVHEAGMRASRILRDMLEYSRRGNAQLSRVRIDTMIDTVLRLADNGGYDLSKIEVVRDYDSGLEDVRCERTEIEQVLLNLIKNAVHAMTHGAAPPHRLTVRTRRERDEVRIEIEDNGPGMDAETQASVFEPFFTTKPEGEGTGLGLSVSYFIVTEQHRGRLSVESQPGKGTRFSIRLPLDGRKAA